MPAKSVSELVDLTSLLVGPLEAWILYDHLSTDGLRWTSWTWCTSGRLVCGLSYKAAAVDLVSRRVSSRLSSSSSPCISPLRRHGREHLQIRNIFLLTKLIGGRSRRRSSATIRQPFFAEPGADSARFHISSHFDCSSSAVCFASVVKLGRNWFMMS